MAEVLITGATGFVGSHLTQRLKKLGAEIAPLSHSKLKSGTYLSELCDFQNCLQLISQHKPKIVFHLAAQPIVETALHAPFNSLEVNIRGAYNLLEALRQTDVSSVIVWMSTDKVYGESDKESKENDVLNSYYHPYNSSKLCGEILAKMYAEVFGLPIVIIRSGNIYGEADFHWDRLIPGISRDLLKGERPKLRSNGSLKRDYIYVDDVINGLILSSTAFLRKEIKSGTIINLGSDKPYSVIEIVDQLASLSGRVDLSPIIEDKAINELVYQHLNYSFAKEHIGWTPKTSLEDGLERTFNWYKSYFGDKK